MDLDTAPASTGRDIDDAFAHCRGMNSHDKDNGIAESRLGAWIVNGLEGEQGAGQDRVRLIFEKQMALDESLVLRLLYDNHIL